jgi:hypothetical protein
MRYAARVDANLAAVVQAYRKLGCSVQVENGVVDLKIGYGGVTELVEVKDGAKSASRRKLTAAQVEFRKKWTGGVRLVMNLDDVQTHVCEMRRRHQWLVHMSIGH